MARAPSDPSRHRNVAFELHGIRPSMTRSAHRSSSSWSWSVEPGTGMAARVDRKVAEAAQRSAGGHQVGDLRRVGLDLLGGEVDAQAGRLDLLLVILVGDHQLFEHHDELSLLS